MSVLRLVNKRETEMKKQHSLENTRSGMQMPHAALDLKFSLPLFYVYTLLTSWRQARFNVTQTRDMLVVYFYG